MTRTEVITRLCEMAAELTDLSQHYEGDPDVSFQLTNLEQCFQKSLHKIQEGGRDV